MDSSADENRMAIESGGMVVRNAAHQQCCSDGHCAIGVAAVRTVFR
jgi:hypothetical protein